MTEHINENPRSNGSVLVSAAVVAGAAGGAASLLNELRRHRKPESTADAASIVREEVRQSADQLRGSAARIIDLTKDQAPRMGKNAREGAGARLTHLSKRATQTGDQMKQKLGDRGVDVDSSIEQAREAIRHANNTQEELRSKGKHKVEKGRKQADANKPDLHAFSQSGRELGQRLRERVPEAGAAVQGQVVPRLADLRQQAEATISGVIDASRTHAPEVAESVQSRVGPKLRDLGKQASEAASTVAETSREHAPELKALLEEHVVPRVQEVTQRAATLASDALETGVERAGQARDGVVPELKHSADDLTKRFAESLGQAERSLSDFRGNASHAVDTVGSQARVVGKNASTGSKNAGATILWTGVAAGVVYVGLLKPEQRQWVRQKAQAAYSGARNIYADIRGQDGEFQTDADQTS